MQGEVPYHIKFSWVYGPPLPVGLDPEQRRAMRIQRWEQILSVSQAAPPSDGAPGSRMIEYPAKSQAGRRPRRKRA